MANVQYRCFAVSVPGLETVCARELESLGIAGGTLLPGGVEFSGGPRELYQANLWLRSAARILVRVGELQARDFPSLYKKLLKLPWGRFLKPGSGFQVKVACHHSRLTHSGRIAGTCREAIQKVLGAEMAEAAGSSVYLRLENDSCQVSVDSSGELLSRRGYRTAAVAAPLRENLAAACLLRLDYDGSLPLIDAMTGSGTFAIEAALIALNRAPGLQRDFAFMAWPKYRPGLWNQLLDEARQAERRELPVSILGVDNNPKAVAAAQQNLQSAGISGQVSFVCQAMQELSPSAPSGLILCNPPYGERLGRNATLQALYRDLGRIYGRTFADWRGALVCPDGALVRHCGVRFKPVCRFSNGGIRVALLEKNG